MLWAVGWDGPGELRERQGVNENKSHVWCPLNAKESETFNPKEERKKGLHGKQSMMASTEGDPKPSSAPL